jgi:2-methylcitrate dehydratase PrpD
MPATMGETMDTTRMLADRVASSDFARLPDDAREVAKQALLDFLGVTLAGIDEPLSRILREESRDQGGNQQAQIFGTRERGTLIQAALLNGAAGHAHDYDDVHNAMSGHPTVPVAPAALALGEFLNSSGRDLINAFCTGVDVECVLGRYAGPGHYASGWHNTGTLGTFGAAAAAARLYGLDPEATVAALGIAGTQAAGLKSQFGTMCKPLHAGQAASTGLQAASLARRGFSSARDILENPQGFMATQANGASVERFHEALAVPAYTQDICFKYHAACYLTHSAIEATSSLIHSNRFDPNDIDSVMVEVDKGHLRVCNIAEPETGLQAKFSLRLTTAMAMTGTDTASIAIYDDDLTCDPQLTEFRDKVEVRAHDGHNPNTIVTINTRSGERFEAACNVAVPSRDLDGQWHRLSEKFLSLAIPVIGDAQAEKVVNFCRTLEDAETLQPLVALLANPNRTSSP